MTHLGPTERRLLRALQTEGEPTDEDRARVRARVLARIAAGGGVAAAIGSASKAAAAGTASVAPPAAAAAGTLGTLKVGAAILAAIGAVGGATWLAASRPEDPAASAPRRIELVAPPVATPTEGVVPARALPIADEDKPAVSPSEVRRTRAAAPVPSSRTKAGDLEHELSLLETAQQALKDGNAQRALATLDEHASSHPDGTLSTERAGIRAVALCEAGKPTEGRREAERFLSANPRSPLAARVHAACLAPKR